MASSYLRTPTLTADVIGFSNPRTQEEEEKTNNIWMKGHAGNNIYLYHHRLIRTLHDTRHRSHKLYGNMEPARHRPADQGLGRSMALHPTR
jgi:hypothetical protein